MVVLKQIIKMDILFVSFENLNSIGVTQKLGTQLKYMQEQILGKASGIIINNVSCEGELLKGWQQKKYKVKPFARIWNKRYFRAIKPFFEFISQRKSRALCLLAALQTNKPDVVYLRYPTADYYLWKLLKQNQQITWVFEHNTKELPELYLNRRKWHDSLFVWWSERIFGRLCLKQAAGVVGVTHEIVNYELTRLRTNKPNFVIGNGIDNQYIVCQQITKKQVYEGVFLIGSYNEWHGLDLLPRLIEQSNNRFHITIVGDVPLNIKIDVGEKSITYKDSVHLNDLSAFLKTFDFGIGTLALHRKNMKEAVSLKTRDYLKNGLPVLLNYYDTDVNGMDGVLLWNKNPNKVTDLLQFLDEEKEVNSAQVENKIGMRNKMEKLVSFIKTLD
ncbi:MAG: glycosyltransferase involved in cell wall biosynthesis [Flavobacteriales bacterium]|jgi:glycosyltransferase involved in cell wall biosynthesis